MERETLSVILCVIGFVAAVPMIIYGGILKAKKDKRATYFFLVGGIGLMTGIAGIVNELAG